MMTRAITPPTIPPMIGPHFLAADAAELGSVSVFPSGAGETVGEGVRASVDSRAVLVGVTGANERDKVVNATVGAAVTVATTCALSDLVSTLFVPVQAFH